MIYNITCKETEDCEGTLKRVIATSNPNHTEAHLILDYKCNKCNKYVSYIDGTLYCTGIYIECMILGDKKRRDE